MGVKLRWVIACAVVGIVAALASNVLAQSGGSFGGGGFGNQNPPPANPGDGGNPLGWLPYAFSFGGSNGIVLIVVVLGAFALVRYLRRGKARGPGGADASGSGALRVQLMLLQGDEVKRELHQIASTGDPTTPRGLSNMVRESILSLMRRPERWVYATVEDASGSESASSQRVESWATTARAAYRAETIRNDAQARTVEYQPTAGGTYCVVTVVVAARDFLMPSVTLPVESNEVRAALTAASGVSPESLIAAEVVWSPDADGEFLTEDQALRLYPSLYHL